MKRSTFSDLSDKEIREMAETVEEIAPGLSDTEKERITRELLRIKKEIKVLDAGRPAIVGRGALKRDFGINCICLYCGDSVIAGKCLRCYTEHGYPESEDD